MSKRKLLISTDFDGTLACPDREKTLAPTFFDWMESKSIKERYDVTWLLNTSRPKNSLLGHLERRFSRRHPDWLIDTGQIIFKWNRKEYLPIEDWNIRWEKDWLEMEPYMEELRNWATKEFNVEAGVYEDTECVTINAGSVEKAHSIVDKMDKWISQHPAKLFIRPCTSVGLIWFDHSNYNKGLLLEEVSKLTGISKEDCFTIGDGQNDLPMLKKEYAQYIACPANSIDMVKEQVLAEGGYVSRHSWDKGVVDSLQYFFGK